ncbi:hypothetical protein FXF51_35040 [Nonomuraea sp. PA05]|uniref:hypothetical protein n=1 Tax=Nonomuraea sp. PA05 TaxID=2604466 RepID=UPI0011D907B6|nr:hypothetical protein [Nonomuraea sp. PA05]TYB59190.1 hypothetical protein FXF51_35040 [Nonomuraea sp. PA05]
MRRKPHRPFLATLLALSLLIWAHPAHAADQVIVLPGATSAEGIAAGAGSTFYAGDLFNGDIFRGDARRGTAERFIDVPDGRMAVGMVADLRHGLLFVAGGFTGQAYVYDLRSGAEVATYQLTDPDTGIVNDTALTRDGAWFTDSLQAKLYFVPIGRKGALGPARTLNLTGPAADTSGEFNLNGIQAADRTLIVAHTTLGKVYTVDPGTGASKVIEGVDVPDADGLVLSGNRLWAVNSLSQVSRFRLDPRLTSGVLEKTITSPLFDFPTTAALIDRHRLAVVNAHLGTIPPTSPTYEVIVVEP